MSLEKIKQDISKHPSNAWALKLGYKPIYSASKTAKILIVGQAPGKNAQESGVPWNDLSGDTLRSWLGISRQVFYDDSKVALLPMDFYYPGKGDHGDLPPRKNFAAIWHPKILSLMPNIKLTILIGLYAQNYYLGRNKKSNLTETVKSYKDYIPNYFPLVHPSPLNFRWQAKNPWFKNNVLTELKKFVVKALEEK